jgi:hypothetical protein
VNSAVSRQCFAVLAAVFVEEYGDADGRTIARIGRRSIGPSDFQGPEFAGFSGDTLLWITNRTLDRVWASAKHSLNAAAGARCE